MRVLYVTSEAAPFYKIGGLGDVAGSLPRTLSVLGVDIRIILPLYDAINRKAFSIPQKPSTIFHLCYGVDKRWERIEIYQTLLPDSTVPVYLVANPTYLSEYHSTHPSRHRVRIVERFVFFSEAIVSWLSDLSGQAGAWFPDVIHLNDWHTSLVAQLVSIHKKEHKLARLVPTLLTIHNLSYHGLQTERIIEETEHLSVEFPKSGRNHRKKIDTLKLGIEAATKLNTVSPAYAREILTPEYGEELDRVLLKRRRDLSGILNGLDYNYWNPSRDKHLVQKLATYPATPLRVNPQPTTHNVQPAFTHIQQWKKVSKFTLQKAVQLPPQPDIPLFAFIGRIEPHQKGIDILLHALEDLIPQGGFQFIILGTGEAIWEDRLHKLVSAQRHPKKIVFVDRFDEALAHQIYAGTDFVVVPSKYEPCGLVQMIAMRYGAIPIVRATGGLADTVKDAKTGLVFTDYSARSLTTAMKRATRLYFDRQVFDRMVRKMLHEDFSWNRSAREYLQVYNKMLQR